MQAHYKCRMRWCPSSVLYLPRSVRLRLCCRRGRNRLPLWIREIWAYMELMVRSLYFNSLTDSDVVFDSIFEPVFLTVDYVTRWFGMVSVWIKLNSLGRTESKPVWKMFFKKNHTFKGKKRSVKKKKTSLGRCKERHNLSLTRVQSATWVVKT